MMRLMGAVTAVVVVAVTAFIYSQNGFDSVHLYLAAGLGVGAAMMLMGALMGLVFLSNGTGHDQSVEEATPREWQRQDDGRNR